jgi:hypothetical protein
MIGSIPRLGVRLAGGLAALVLAVLATGCAKPMGNVSGTLKYNGQALDKGTITFYDKDNQARSSEIKDGKYEVTKVRGGTVKIAIVTPRPMTMVMGGKSSTVPGAKVIIPDHYGDPEKSGLTLEVTRGDQTKDFDLK